MFAYNGVSYKLFLERLKGVVHFSGRPNSESGAGIFPSSIPVGTNYYVLLV